MRFPWLFSDAVDSGPADLRKHCITHSFVLMQSMKQGLLDIKLSVTKTRKHEFLKKTKRVVASFPELR